MSMQPLHGIRVLELGSFITAPVAGMILADLGAEVIKVERPNGGDPFRSFNGTKSAAYFRAYNRSKKSIVVDLNDERGQESIKRLAASSDILLANFRPGYLERLGLGYEPLSQLNSRLIYCSITGFGAEGPYRGRPSYDVVGQAMSGLLSLFIDPNAPQLTGFAISDNVTGIYAAVAILGGLVQRERNDKGLRIETNQLAATMALIGHSFVQHFETGKQPEYRDASKRNHSFVFRCRDEKLIVIHLSSPPKFWQALLRATDSTASIGSDPRYADRRGRTLNYDALRSALAEIFLRQPRSYWLAKLEEHDVPFSSVNTLAETVDDPQVAHLGTMFDVRHPLEGVTRLVGRPIWFDGDDGHSAAFASPTLGEHTESILSSLGQS